MSIGGCKLNDVQINKYNNKKGLNITVSSPNHTRNVCDGAADNDGGDDRTGVVDKNKIILYFNMTRTM